MDELTVAVGVPIFEDGAGLSAGRVAGRVLYDGGCWGCSEFSTYITALDGLLWSYDCLTSSCCLI